MAAAHGVLEGLAMIDHAPVDDDGCIASIDQLGYWLEILCERYDIPLDTHLTKSEKSDVAAGAVPGPPKTKDAPY